MALKRCGECASCLTLEQLKSKFMPNPPFTHASDGMSQVWNTQCLTYMCETWTHEQLVDLFKRLANLPIAIRPPEAYLEEARVKLKLELT